jgi:hypothetical protein
MKLKTTEYMKSCKEILGPLSIATSEFSRLAKPRRWLNRDRLDPGIISMHLPRPSRSTTLNLYESRSRLGIRLRSEIG